MDKNFIFKSIKMGKELQIAGEFIYESAKRMMALSSFESSFEINSILYNGAVGIERVQKVLICMIKINSSEDCDDKKLSDILHGHNHQQLQELIKKECGLKFSKEQNKILELFQNYYKNYRYADYLYDEYLNINELFITFLNNYKEFNAEFFLSDEELTFFRKKYINGLGNIAKKYFDLIRQNAYKLNVYTYEMDSSTNASNIFKSQNGLYEQLVLERSAISELLISFRKNTFGKYSEYINDFKELDLDSAMMPDYIYDLLNYRTNDTLTSMVEEEYEEMDESELKKRQELLQLMSSNNVFWDIYEEDDYEFDINIDEQ